MDFVVEFDHDYLFRRMESHQWLEEFWRGKKIGNVIAHYFTQISYLKEMCRQLYPTNSTSPLFVENCALAHFNKFGEDGHTPRFLFDFATGLKWYDKLDYYLTEASNALPYIGVLLSLLQIGFRQKYLWYFVIIVNVSCA